MNSKTGLVGLGRFYWVCRGGRSRGLRRARIGIQFAIVREGGILVRVFVFIEWLVWNME